MEVIPVLDLKAGRAVHARGGDRNRYRIVRGVLGGGEDPVALATAFRDRLGCRSLYVAALDAVARAGDEAALVQGFAALSIELLVDAGVRTMDDARRIREAGATRVVVGSETLERLDILAAIVSAIGAERTVFSLDLRGGRALVAGDALASSTPVDLASLAVSAGVRDVLVLDLERVGSETGPPVEWIARIRDACPDARLLAGGGVRDAGDLQTLAELGCAGALVGTALHQGTISRPELDRFRAARRVAPGTTQTGQSSPRPPVTAS